MRFLDKLKENPAFQKLQAQKEWMAKREQDVPEKEEKIQKVPVKQAVRPQASETDMSVIYQEERNFLTKIKNQVEAQRNNAESKINLVKGIMEIEDEVVGSWFKKFKGRIKPSHSRRRPKMFKPGTAMRQQKPYSRPARARRPKTEKQYYRGQTRFLNNLIERIDKRMSVVDKFSGNDVKGCSSCRVGRLTIMQRWLNSLPAPNWQGKFGGIPTTPGYPESPTTCPLSIRTNLKRIFFAGVNLLNRLNAMTQRGQTQQALNYLNQLKPQWLQWLSEVDRLHGGKSKQHKSIVKFFQALFEYMFNYPDPKKFAEDLSKVAIFAYDTY